MLLSEAGEEESHRKADGTALTVQGLITVHVSQGRDQSKYGHAAVGSTCPEVTRPRKFQRSAFRAVVRKQRGREGKMSEKERERG